MVDFQELLRELEATFIYNPFTGTLRRKYKYTGKMKGKVVECGTKSVRGYLVVRFNKKTITVHRIAWMLFYKEPAPESIDHINRIKTDNRITNLRAATPTQQLLNTPIKSDNTSGFKGVSYFKRDDKWRAYTSVNGKFKHIGYYETPEEASEAYNREVTRLYGEYANTNK